MNDKFFQRFYQIRLQKVGSKKIACASIISLELTWKRDTAKSGLKMGEKRQMCCMTKTYPDQIFLSMEIILQNQFSFFHSLNELPPQYSCNKIYNSKFKLNYSISYDNKTNYIESCYTLSILACLIFNFILKWHIIIPFIYQIDLQNHSREVVFAPIALLLPQLLHTIHFYCPFTLFCFCFPFNLNFFEKTICLPETTFKSSVSFT